MASEDQPAGFALHPEYRDIIAPLIAGIKELAGGVEIKAPGIIPTCPFLADEGQFSFPAHGKYPNAVVQTVAGIQEPAIARQHNLRAEVAPGEARRQAGDGLPWRETPLCPVVIEEDDIGAFLLDRIAPVSVGVEREVPRTITRGKRDRRGIIGR